MPPTPSSVLALDVGEARVGVAVASLTARLPRPFTTLGRGPQFLDQLQKIIAAENVAQLVVGLPRNLSGGETGQTTSVKAFADTLREQLNIPIHFQDEAVTSKQAEAELQARGKPYQAGDIDALAATYILEDYLGTI